jgi:hypothetical protein
MVAASYLQYEVQEEVFLQRRPALLTFLCVMTFIASGLNIISYLSALLSQSAFVLSMTTVTNKLGLSQGFEIYTVIIMLVITLMTFFATLRMWNLKKSGFWYYIISKILFIAMTLSILNFIVTFFVVMLYWLNYKEMD